MESNTLFITSNNEIKKLRDLKIGDYLITGNLAKPNLKIENITTFTCNTSLKVSQKLGDDIIFSPTQKVMFNLKGNRQVSKASSGVENRPFQVSWFSREDSQWKTFKFETFESAKEFADNLTSNDTIIETLPNLGLMNVGQHLQFLKSGEIEFGELNSAESLRDSLDPYLIGVWCDNTHSYNTKINDYLKKTSRLPCFIGLQTRKKILAGILDSKGKYLKDYNCFEVTINSDTGLREDTLFIARSLGFLASSHNKYVYISGNFNTLNLQINLNFPDSSGYSKLVSDVTEITVLNSPKQFVKLSLLNNQPVLLADFTLVMF